MHRPVYFVGDIHLGRTPHRLAGVQRPMGELGPTEAFKRVVRRAIEDHAEAVVLAGDVVDQDNDRFEAFRPLYEGVKELVEAGIKVIGVAGNHDSVALPLLSSRIPDFVLLGRGGRWEHLALDGLDLIGWSFPSRHHSHNPLDSDGLDAALKARSKDRPAVAVLHADLDAAQSSYAPVYRSELAKLGCDAVVVGHVHKPNDLTVRNPVGYLGSLVGLDRGEPGPRGPWRATTDGGLTLEHVPLGPVAWHVLDVSVDDEVFDGPTALDELLARITKTASAAATQQGWLTSMDAVGCTVRLVGRTGNRSLAHTLMNLDASERVVPVGDCQWAVVACDDATRPRLDIDRWAQEKTPLGQLAALYQRLQANGVDALPDSVVRALDAFSPAPWERGEPPAMPDRVATAQRALAQMMDQLHDQQRSQEVV